MMCEHDMDHLPFTNQKHCRNCGKSEQEIDLEADLVVAQAELAAAQKELELQVDNAIYFSNREAAERQRAEQAEAQYIKLKEENSKLASAAIEQPPYKTDLVDRLHRMEGALRGISNVTSKCLSHEEMKDKMKKIAKAALEDKP